MLPLRKMVIPMHPPPAPPLGKRRPLHPQDMPVPDGVSRTVAAPRLRDRLQQEPIAAPAEDRRSLFPTPAPPKRRCTHDANGGVLAPAKLLAHPRATYGLGFLIDDSMVSALNRIPAVASVVPSSPADQLTPTPTAADVAAPEEAVEQYAARLRLDLGSFYVPKEGEHPLGEDAHFVSKALDAFGVADGVGGWTKRGVDAGEFARQLMSLCEVELEAASCRGTATAETALEGVLERALARTTVRGTSTACIGVVDGRLLRAVNVGDSGFLVVRGGKIVYHSSPQKHGFNRPYQVGRVAERDPPESANRICVEIEAGDIIVAGTDGLFDNLFDAEILDVLARAKADGQGTPEGMARAVGWAAVEAYVVGEETPFSAECREAKVAGRGGKPDDVTVVVASIW